MRSLKTINKLAANYLKRLSGLIKKNFIIIMNNSSFINQNIINQVFQNIDSEEKLNDFLEQNRDQNQYCRFILEKKSLAKSTSGRVEIHHIIPLHVGGPEFEAWNLLLLSFDDHTHAHYLLSEEYNSKLDKYTYYWRSGLTEEARSLQREYAQTKSVFLDSKMQSKFGKVGGSTWTLKREQAYIKNQSDFVQKAFQNGMIWYYQPDNILIRVLPQECKLISQLIQFFKKRISYIVSEDQREISVFSGSLSRVINGKSLNTYNGFFLVGIITNPFTHVKFNLRPYYQNTSNRVSLFKEKFETKLEMRQNIGKSLGKRSFSVELTKNLQFTTVWFYSDKDLTVQVKPCTGVKQLVEQLQTYINVIYTDKEKKQFSALIKNRLIGKTRKGWTLLEIKDNVK